jgi:hypothetical protein
MMNAAESLKDAAQHQQRNRQSACWCDPDQQRAGDAEDEPPHQDLHASDPIGETANDDDEDA